jgi:hypothetical protein
MKTKQNKTKQNKTKQNKRKWVKKRIELGQKNRIGKNTWRNNQTKHRLCRMLEYNMWCMIGMVIEMMMAIVIAYDDDDNDGHGDGDGDWKKNWNVVIEKRMEIEMKIVI